MNEFRKIGRYEVESLLGEGAMGSVFKATDPNIGRTVAIKIVKFDRSAAKSETDEFRKRFQQEARISGSLNHPNIVAVYDVADHEGMPYIAMEFVDGKTLSDWIYDPNNRDLGMKVNLLAKLAVALDIAHEKGIVHRDLKPANIMVTRDGEPKIMDFGIAKMTGTNLTVTGVFLGTPSYSSPEQIKEGHVDRRSDIFSFGILACEVLTGALPFPGKSLNGILYKIANEEPTFPDLGGLPINISRFREIFGKVLHKDPDQRYQMASEFTKDLLSAVSLGSQDRTRVDQTISSMVTFSTAAEKVQLSRSEFETANAETVVIAPDKKKGGGLILLMGIIALAFAGGTLYLHSQGKLVPMIDSVFNKEKEPVQEVVKDPEPEVTEPDIKSADTKKPESETVAEPPKPIVKTFSVTSDPAGANVLRDGVTLGITPFSMEWDKATGSQLQLVISKVGFEDSALNLSFGDTLEPSYSLTLKALPVERTIRSNPKGAIVYAGAEKLGPTPVKYSILPGNSVKLRFVLSGYHEKRLTYTEGKSSEGDLSVSMKKLPPPGTLKVSSMLTGLRVDVDGKRMNGTSLKLQPGTYEVRLRASRYFYDEKRSVKIQSKKTETLETPIVITIPKVDVIGGFAKVKIDGAYVMAKGKPDVTPLANLRVVAGRHRFEFVDQDGKIVHSSIIDVHRSEPIVVDVHN